MTLAPGDVPVLPRGVRVHQDTVRGQVVLLVPEKVIVLDPIGEAILSRVTGQTSFAGIVDDLAATFQAPQDRIETDVQTFLGRLRARLYLDIRA